MNPTTFGNTQCAKNLVTILQEENNPTYQKLISRFIISNNRIINEIAKIEDNNVKMTLCNIYMESLKKSNIKVPKKILTHGINVLIAKLKQDVIHSIK